jgi:signal transduction histidine kinase
MAGASFSYNPLRMAGIRPHRKADELEVLKKKADKKNEFFMAASHQLKSPVAITQWCLQSILEMPSVDAKAKEMVRKSLTQANAMSQLITDMLHVFRLQDRQGKAQTYLPVDLNALIEQVITQNEVQAHNRKVHLVRGPIEVLPPVLADQGYLRQAIINLVDNAIKYSPDGGTVTVNAGVTRDHFVEITVQDEGIGIPETEQSRLFTEFFRGEEARVVSHEGTGLGLVLVRNIVEEFGGEVSLESEFHKGSTFTVRLPVAR